VVIGAISMPESAPMKAASVKESLPASVVRDAHQARAGAVDGGGAQRLAVQRALEEQVQRHDQQRSHPSTHSVWPLTVSGPGRSWRR
jgi:hypothetical protein